MPGPHIGVLAKWPVPGRVKTRLVPPLTPEEAATLYRAFVSDLMATLDGLGCDRTLLLDQVHDPGQVGWPRWPVIQQADGDLGARLEAAAEALCAGGAPCVLIGSDHPDLPATLIAAACTELAQADVVLGPTTDGGYYAIGMGRPIPQLFRSMPWSTPSLFARTVERAAELGLEVTTLVPWDDVDTADDVRALETRLTKSARATNRGDRRPPGTLAVIDALSRAGAWQRQQG